MSQKQPVNILLVDDQPAKLLSYEAILTNLGENLIRANSGKEALEQLLKRDIAVVLIDVCMPELDGFELASMIRNHPRFGKTAIILVSGVLVEDADRLRGYGSGAMDYVSVPIIPEILRAKVSVFADLFRKTEELEQLNHRLEELVAERTAEIESLLDRAQEARREAETANRLKDEFLATLSHELRTPLNAITGWAYILGTGGLDPAEQMRAIETISRNAQLQNQLISDLLDVSRIVAGKLQLTITELDLRTIVEAAVDSLRPAAALKDVQLEVDLGPDPRAPVSGDAARLQQIVSNLLSNAVKFGPGGSRVRISMRTRHPWIEIDVQDEGPGIEPSMLPHVFERFRQGDSSSTRTHHGLGLGLAIVRHLVEMHGGMVLVSNRADRPGAIFKVALPSAVERFSRAGEPRPPISAEDGNGLAPAPSLDGLRVLIVDDDADGREAVSAVLKRSGAETLLAASAAQGFELLRLEEPDVLVADIEMPDEDGYSFLRRVRALSSPRLSRTPAIALTAYASSQDRRNALGSGFQSHVAKPLDPAEFVALVASLARNGTESAGRDPGLAREETPHSPAALRRSRKAGKTVWT